MSILFFTFMFLPALHCAVDDVNFNQSLLFRSPAWRTKHKHFIDTRNSSSISPQVNRVYWDSQLLSTKRSYSILRFKALSILCRFCFLHLFFFLLCAALWMMSISINPYYSDHQRDGQNINILLTHATVAASHHEQIVFIFDSLLLLSTKSSYSILLTHATVAESHHEHIHYYDQVPEASCTSRLPSL